LNLNHCS
jgi:hypothetical protein